MRRFILLLVATPLFAQQTPYPIRTATALPKIVGDNPEGRLTGVQVMLVSKAERIYVLEGPRACVVKSFDAKGKFVKAFGRTGDDPGQCIRPIGLLMDDTSIVVVDGGPAPARGAPPPPAGTPAPPLRLVAFSLDGKTLGVKSTTMQEYAASQRALRGGARLAVGGSGKARVVGLMKPGSASVDTLLAYAADLATIERNGRAGMSPSGFGDGGAFAQSGDTLIVVADGVAGTVKWFAIDESGAATLKRTESMGMTGSAITPQDVADRAERLTKMANTTAAAPVASGRNRGGGDEPPAPAEPVVIKMSNAPEMTSVATNIMFASDGSTWVSSPRRALYLTGDPGERYQDVKVTYTVFPPNGKPYAVRMPIEFIVSRIVGDKLFGYIEPGQLTIYQLGPG